MAIEDNSHVQGFVAIDGNDSQKHPLDIDPEYVMGYPRSSGSSVTLAERLDTLVSMGGTQTITGEKTFTAPISGTISVAEKLQTARNLGVALDGSAAAPFDGSANQLSIPVSGTLPIANGGTGATAVADIQAGKDGDGNTITSTYATKADVADEMATKADAEDLGITDKRVDNLASLLNGALSVQQTDATAAYAKTVPNGAQPYAAVQKIGGKTLCWNQLVNIPAGDGTTTTNDLTTVKTGNTYTITGTASATTFNAIQIQVDGFVQGHKYFVGGIVKNNSTGSQAMLGLYRQDIISLFTSEYGAIGEATGTGYATFQSNIYQNAVVDMTVIPQVHDLTLMFGAGNEPATVADFTAMFPASYYTYDAGTLKSAGVTGAVSVGKNGLSMIPFRYGGGFYNQPVGTVIEGNAPTVAITENNGVFTYQVGSWEGCIFIAPFKPNTNYYRTFTCSTTGGMRSSTYILDADFKVLAAANLTTSPADWSGLVSMTLSNAAWYAFAVGSNEASTVTITKPQFELGSTATAYTPYMTATLPIPAAVQALPGYGWSAGNVCNEIDWQRKVYIQRVASVDLGTQNWSKSTSGLFQTFISGIRQKSDKDHPSGFMISAMYIEIASADITGPDGTNPSPDKVMALANYNTLMYFNNLSYSDAATFRSAMSGVYLYYELATPIETDISSLLSDDNLIEVESGGTVSFPNALGDDYRIPVPSDVEYTIDLAPDTPTTDGTYTLQCTVTDGVATYSWVSA